MYLPGSTPTTTNNTTLTSTQKLILLWLGIGAVLFVFSHGPSALFTLHGLFGILLGPLTLIIDSILGTIKMAIMLVIGVAVLGVIGWLFATKKRT
jgi:hypothetical protein